MPLPQVVIIGNLTADPELRFTASGTAIANMRVASQDRKRDDSGNWVDGDSTFLNVTAWRKAGENVAESLKKGDRVIVWGRLRERTYTAKDGNERTTFEVEADDIAPSLFYKPSRPVDTTRAQQQPAAATDDPWATPAPF